MLRKPNNPNNINLTKESLVTPNQDEIIKYHSRKGAFYTAFPSPGLWEDSFQYPQYRDSLKDVYGTEPDLPTQFYVHFPFCKTQCWYCQCFQVVSRNQEKMDHFMEYMFKEIDLHLEFFEQNGIKPNFNEIHLGGGTPSYISPQMFDKMIAKLRTFIDIDNIEEFAIEIDPRTTDKEKLQAYRDAGINRVSFGIQDFDLKVQKAINRVQPVEMIEELLEMRHLFKGVNFDLIYGMPLQTRESLRKTLETVMRLSPDRIAFSILGYRPDVFRHNANINADDIPGFIEKAYMWEASFPFFLEHGYERVGMDHFARPDDELTIAKNNEVLFRNQMGYSPGRFADNLGIGPSGMSRLKNYYTCNSYSLDDYKKMIDEKTFPVIRGITLNRDLEIRRDVMNKIMVYYHVNFTYFNHLYNIEFKDYFKKELEAMREFVEIGALEINEDSFSMTPYGNFFLRNICIIFDNLGKEYKHNMETGVKIAAC